MGKRGRNKAKHAKSETAKSSNKPPSGVVDAHGAIAQLTLTAQDSFFVAADAIDSGVTCVSKRDATVVYDLISWKNRTQMLKWFSAGAKADPSARLTFSPQLTKPMRKELHRMTTAMFTSLQSQAIGFGDARCIRFASKDEKLDDPIDALTPEQVGSAEALYTDLRTAGEEMSLDEVKTRIAAEQLTERMQTYLKQTQKDREAIQAMLTAIKSGQMDPLAASLAGNESLVTAGIPARGTSILPLQLAASLGHVNQMKLLIDAGAPLEQPDGSGTTPLKAARKAEQCDAEGLLLQRGALDPETDVLTAPKPAPPSAPTPAAAAAMTATSPIAATPSMAATSTRARPDSVPVALPAAADATSPALTPSRSPAASETPPTAARSSTACAALAATPVTPPATPLTDLPPDPPAEPALSPHPSPPAATPPVAAPEVAMAEPDSVAGSSEPDSDSAVPSPAVPEHYAASPAAGIASMSENVQEPPVPDGSGDSSMRRTGGSGLSDMEGPSGSSNPASLSSAPDRIARNDRQNGADSSRHVVRQEGRVDGINEVAIPAAPSAIQTARRCDDMTPADAPCTPVLEPSDAEDTEADKVTSKSSPCGDAPAPNVAPEVVEEAENERAVDVAGPSDAAALEQSTDGAAAEESSLAEAESSQMSSIGSGKNGSHEAVPVTATSKPYTAYGKVSITEIEPAPPRPGEEEVDGRGSFVVDDDTESFERPANPFLSWMARTLDAAVSYVNQHQAALAAAGVATVAAGVMVISTVATLQRRR